MYNVSVNLQADSRSFSAQKSKPHCKIVILIYVYFCKSKDFVLKKKKRIRNVLDSNETVTFLGFSGG